MFYFSCMTPVAKHFPATHYCLYNNKFYNDVIMCCWQGLFKCLFGVCLVVIVVWSYLSVLIQSGICSLPFCFSHLLFCAILSCATSLVRVLYFYSIYSIILFYSIPFYYILVYSIIVYSILFYSILFYPILLYCINLVIYESICFNILWSMIHQLIH